MPSVGIEESIIVPKEGTLGSQDDGKQKVADCNPLAENGGYRQRKLIQGVYIPTYVDRLFRRGEFFLMEERADSSCPGVAHCNKLMPMICPK